MRSASRVLVVGLDGATFDLIDPLVGAGYLPTLRRLLAEGAHGRLQCWPHTNSAAAWSSMVTGYNPGEHGVYHFGNRTPQRGAAYRPTTGRDRARDPFWRLLGDAGRHVGVVNVPITYPADRVNGFMLAGMDTPSVGSPGFAHPPDLPDELRRAGIDYLIDVPNLKEARRRDHHALPRSVERMIAGRARAVLHLMRTRPWDVLMAVFVATDRVQHHFWPPPGAAVDGPAWTPIREVYRQLDGFLGQALDAASGDVTVLVVSDHGFGPIRLALRCLDGFFAGCGLLHRRERGSGMSGWALRNLLLYGRRFIPQSLQRSLALALPSLRLRALGETRMAGIDWARTRAFSDGLGWEISLNVRGRQPEGIVPPADREALAEQVRALLLGLRDPESGRSVVRSVDRREALFHGPFAAQAPDLMIDWDYETVGDALAHPDIPGAIAPYENPGPWIGTHRPDGIFIAWGAGVRAGVRVQPVIWDVAPTVLHLQEHPIPDDMDGRVLTEIFTDADLDRRPLRPRQPAVATARPAPAELGPEEQRLVEERLRGLGYIE